MKPLARGHKRVSSYFEGRNVLLTGASSGIGHALALTLAQSRANLWALGRSRRRLRRLQDALGATGVPGQELRTASLELRDSAAIRGFTQRLESSFPVDVLINCAGVAHTRYLHEMTLGQIEELVATNLTSAMVLTRLMAPSMGQRGGGHVAFVASLAALINFTGYLVYGATKAALLSFATGLRREYARDGLEVSVLLPGDVETPMLERERSTCPPETLRVSGTVRPTAAGEAANNLLVGMTRRRFLITPGLRSKLASVGLRLAPRFFVDLLVDVLGGGRSGSIRPPYPARSADERESDC